MSNIAGRNIVAIAAEEQFGQFVSDPSAFFVLQPWDFKMPNLVQEYIEPKAQRPYLASEKGFLGTKSGKFELSLPLRSHGTITTQTQQQVHGISQILSVCLPGEFAGTGGTIATAPQEGADTIEVSDQTDIMPGMLVLFYSQQSATTIAATVMDVSESSNGKTLRLSRPIQGTNLAEGDPVYASYAHFAAKGFVEIENSLCAEISDINYDESTEGHVWRLLGMKGSAKIDASKAGEHATLFAEFMLHSWDTPESSSVAFDSQVKQYPQSPAPLLAAGANFYIDGEPLAIAGATIEISNNLAEAKDITSPEARSDFVLSGMEIKGHFEPLYERKFDRMFGQLQEFSIEMLLGTDPGNCVGIYIPRAVITNAPQTEDKDGILARPVQFKALIADPLPEICISFA